MARLIPAVERVKRARALIQKTLQLPAPENTGMADFSYVAQVKDLLRQARDYVKFIPQSPGASSELKADVEALFKEIEQTENELLHKSI